jgi:hypothetical protein
MTNPTNLDNLTPQQESLVLDAIEGELRPDQMPDFERLLAERPGLEAEIARLTGTRNMVVSLGTLAEPEIDLADSVLEQVQSLTLEAETPVLQLQHMDPPSGPRLQLSSAGVRTLAAAAAVVIIAALSFSYLRSGSGKPPETPGPGIAAAPGPTTTDPSTNPAIETAPVFAQAEVELRRVELAQSHWTEAETTEPTLTEAAGLLSRGQLVIRTLAPGREIARDSLAALEAGLDSDSTAWHIVGPSTRTVAARFDHPTTTGPLMAMDDQSGLTLEIPRARLLDVWTARVEPNAAAIASLMHGLEELGFKVRLEALPEPIELDDPLEDALWWDRSPSTWAPIESAPIVIDTLDR